MEFLNAKIGIWTKSFHFIFGLEGSVTPSASFINSCHFATVHSEKTWQKNKDSHFDKGVRVAIRIHGGQVGTANNSHNQRTLLCGIQQRDQDTATLDKQRKRKSACFH